MFLFNRRKEADYGRLVNKNPQYPGWFITLEGPEGAGKTTQLKILREYLQNLNVSYLITRDPGGTTLGKQIRRILLSVDSPVHSMAELLLYEADRSQHVHELIMPALQEGKLVICDRYIDSTFAYQGYARGHSLELIKQLNQIATGGLIPEITILFDLPSEQGLNRLHPSGHDRIERETIEFHHKVRAGYLELASANAERFRVIDASRPLSVVQEELRAILAESLNLSAR